MNRIIKVIGTAILISIFTNTVAQSTLEISPVGTLDITDIAITGIRISGNHTINSAKLWEIIEKSGNNNLARLLPAQLREFGAQVTLNDLQEVARTITQIYRDSGYLLATAYVKGEANDGSVSLENEAATIIVLEGILDQVEVSGATRYPAEKFKQYLEEPLCARKTLGCQGTLITQTRMERAISLLGDIPGIAVINSKLSPGSLLGSSNYSIKLKSLPVLSGVITVDNFGNRYLGKNHINAHFLFNSPLGYGEQIGSGITYSGSESSSGYFDASLPFGYNGLRVGAGYHHSLYNLGDPFETVNARGKADTGKVYAQYPLIRGDTKNLSLKLSYSFKAIVDKVLDYTLQKKAHVVQIMADGSTIDNLLGGGATVYGVGLSKGTVSASTEFPDAPGSFGKLSYQLSRDQTLIQTSNSSRSSIFASLRGQFATANLDSSEKFSLGGPDGVRAYPTGEAVGDQGTLLSIALRYSRSINIFTQTDISLGIFVDAGWLNINHTPLPAEIGPNRRKLFGYGLEASFINNQRYQTRLIWARRGSGSYAATSDEDSRDRFWILGSMAY